MMYKTKISSDYFNVKGLETRIGLSAHNWRFAILKELIDNALDAIEPKRIKQVEIIADENSFKIFDNGDGFSIDDVNMIYDFDNYVSKNRHVITASRGKQGNGLKSIIGMCYVNKYTLLWHTDNGIVIEAVLDASRIQDEDLDVTFKEAGRTGKKGIEIIGCNYADWSGLEYIVEKFSICNRDVSFILKNGDNVKSFQAKVNTIDHTGETSLSFYTFNDFKRLIAVQEPDMTYKTFLAGYFGTRISNKSSIKSKIENLYLQNTETDIKNDFEGLKSIQKNKPCTLLKKYLLGFDHMFEAFIHMEGVYDENDIFPCLVEFNVIKLDNKLEHTYIDCYVNHSITYHDGASITFRNNAYKISHSRNPVIASDLDSLLKGYNDYAFEIHIVAPYLKFENFGKTRIDAGDFIDLFVTAIRKAISKVNREYNKSNVKKPTQKFLAEKYMTQAFLYASSFGKYAITARQMYYKLRELARQEDLEWETNSTYSSFTQEWLTAWLEQNEHYEDKVNFSERGNYYIDGTQWGLGTANVRALINHAGEAANRFTLYGGLQDQVHILPDFDLKYEYNKALYIEKTGFDAVFKAEKLDEKYNMIIISGQGFASRAARALLYYLQQQGLTLYCMHDLDLSGVSIYETMRQENDKFRFNLDIINLGITPQDVFEYNIIPEIVDKVDEASLFGMDDEHLDFFDKGNKSQRVELNAFSTEQLLELIDRKLKNDNRLPYINLSRSLEFDNKTLREIAFLRVIKEQYAAKLENIHLQFDLDAYNNMYTMNQAKEMIPVIREDLISRYKKEIVTSLDLKNLTF